MDVTLENMQTLSRIDIPKLRQVKSAISSKLVNANKRRLENTHSTSRIITPTNHLIPTNLHTPHTILMTSQLMHRRTSFNVPYPQSGITRT